MKAKIIEKKEVAKGTMLFRYQLIDGDIYFISGQSFFITLANGLVHHFTVVNSPSEKGIFSMATRMRNSEFKNTLKDLPLGSEVEIDRISGEFILPNNTIKPLVFIALGIGITPYVSMMRFIKEQKLDYKITLIYSDSDKESMAFLDEMESYTNENFKIILTITKDPNWQGERRHIDGQFIKDYFENPIDNIFYISGPPAAVDAVSKNLADMGIDKSSIKTEDFFGY